MCVRRDGEASLQYLISCSERYLRAHTESGFSGSEADRAALAAVRDRVDRGLPEPAAGAPVVAKDFGVRGPSLPCAVPQCY